MPKSKRKPVEVEVDVDAEENYESDDDAKVPTIHVPSLRRILKRVGVTRILSDVYDYMRNDIINFVTCILKDVLVFTNIANRKTVKLNDLYNALSFRGVDLLIGYNPNSSKTSYLQSCTSKGASAPKVSTSTKKVSLHVKAKRAIKFCQKNGGYLAIPKTNFSNLVRHIAKELRPEDDYHFQEVATSLFQHVTESYMLRKYQAAYQVALHSDHKTLMSKDVHLVANILKHGTIQSQPLF